MMNSYLLQRDAGSFQVWRIIAHFRVVQNKSASMNQHSVQVQLSPNQFMVVCATWHEGGDHMLQGICLILFTSLLQTIQGSPYKEPFVPADKPPAEKNVLRENISFFTLLLVPLKPSATIRSQVWCEGGCPSVPCMSSHCSKPEHPSEWRIVFCFSLFIFLRLLGKEPMQNKQTHSFMVSRFFELQSGVVPE